uniref:Uncharacterized protein n=1 Tax=Marseillevirus LCMAC201 TaxID=2506605 RepID=A0A481YXX0_9VIRU|nr:MAG: hypothetical protein LCMAC201_02160 [Marseillevirus LCMAC201]
MTCTYDEECSCGCDEIDHENDFFSCEVCGRNDSHLQECQHCDESMCDQCDGSLLNCEHYSGECPHCNDEVRSLCGQCLYCLLSGKLDLQSMWDNYGEVIMQGHSVYINGVKDGYAGITKPTTTKCTIEELVTIYNDGYDVGTANRDTEASESEKEDMKQKILDYMFSKFNVDDFNRCYWDSFNKTPDNLIELSYAENYNYLEDNDVLEEFGVPYKSTEFIPPPSGSRSEILSLKKFHRGRERQRIVSMVVNYFSREKNIDLRKMTQNDMLSLLKKFTDGVLKEYILHLKYLELQNLNKTILSNKNAKYIDFLYQLMLSCDKSSVILHDKEHQDPMGFKASGFIFDFNGNLMIFNER